MKKFIGIFIIIIMIGCVFNVNGLSGKISNSHIQYENIDIIFDDEPLNGGLCNKYDNLNLELKTEHYLDLDDEYIPGEIILGTTWHQSGIYAMKTPLVDPHGDPDDPDNHWRLGCWSTAIGQIINYHQLQSHGKNHFTCNGAFDKNGNKIVIDNNLDDHTYNWTLMSNKLYPSSSDDEIESVCTFLYDVSTVIQKDFGTGTYCISSSEMINELISHFDFISRDTIFKTPSINEIQEEINDLRPLMLYIRNKDQSRWHAIVLDGYLWEDDTFYVHLNLGWDGLHDGWYDYNGEVYVYDDTSYRRALFIRLNNYRPYIPKNPVPEDGMASVEIDQLLQWDGGDPESGDQIYYDICFGTSRKPQIMEKNCIETIYYPGNLEYYKKYNWQIISRDTHGRIIKGPIWSFYTCIDPNNVAPDIPQINGPVSGRVGNELSYFFVSNDSNGDDVSFYIDWGDNSFTDWTFYKSSGIAIELSHTWDNRGDYIVKAKSKDIYDVESDWATLAVTVPKSKSISDFNPRFIRLIERFPILELLI